MGIVIPAYNYLMDALEALQKQKPELLPVIETSYEKIKKYYRMTDTPPSMG